jgi:hypothetical protein
MGADYPFPWTKTAVDHILATPGLSDGERVAILEETAEKLLAVRARYGEGRLRVESIRLETDACENPTDSLAGNWQRRALARSPSPQISVALAPQDEDIVVYRALYLLLGFIGW